MYRLAMLSFHGCPVARLGEKDTGGMNVYVLQLAKELGKRGNRVDVYTRRHDPGDPQIVDLGDGARVIHLDAGPHDGAKDVLYQYIPEFLSSLRAFQRTEGVAYDLIHSHYWLSSWVGTVLSKDWNVPHALTFHTLAKNKLRARAGEAETELRLSTEKRLADSVDAIVVSTTEEKEDLRRYYQVPRHRVQVIPPGVDLELFQPMEKADARQLLGLREEKVILYVGRVEPLKGLDILPQAVAILDDAANTRLLIVGGSSENDRELQHLGTMAQRLGIEDSVTFTGSLRQTELPTYYSAADVFVLPSYYESFGLVALEAMACGTPVVASRVGGLKTFVEDGKTGYLIPWRCPEPFAQRLDVLLANPDLRATMGKAARSKARQMSWSGVVDRMQDFYAFLLGETWESIAGA